MSDTRDIDAEFLRLRATFEAALDDWRAKGCADSSFPASGVYLLAAAALMASEGWGPETVGDTAMAGGAIGSLQAEGMGDLKLQAALQVIPGGGPTGEA